MAHPRIAQVLGKSGKMVPVMAGGILLGGKRYSLSEYAQVTLVTVGVIVFNFGGKAKKGGEDSSYGLLLILASLIMDAVTGTRSPAIARHGSRVGAATVPAVIPRSLTPMCSIGVLRAGGLQDKVKTKTKTLNADVKAAKPTMHESMLYTNLSGCLVAGVLAFFAGHLTDGVAFCLKYPEVMQALVIYSLSSAVGQNFIYYTITQFNPLLLTTVTTTRKIFSTLYSVFRDPSNSLSNMQWSGCGLVFFGLFIEVGSKYLKPAAKPVKEESGGKAKGRAKKVD